VQLFATCAATTALGGASAYLFHRIYKNAGLMMVPFAVWCGFYTVLTYNMMMSEAANGQEISVIRDDFMDTHLSMRPYEVV
jgi:predicted membrane-bound mannosyltransferase